jgi:hypothetical protein
VYVTTNYLGVHKGVVNYLFFLLTEDYIEAKGGIADALRPALVRFGKGLGASGAVVVPFEGEATSNLERVINPGGGEESTLQKLVKGRTPGLLVLDSSLQDFDPARHRFLFISLRDSIGEFGDVKVFEVEELLQMLTQAAAAVGLFEAVEKYQNKKNKTGAARLLSDSTQLRPSFMGISVDLKQAYAAYKAWRKK